MTTWLLLLAPPPALCEEAAPQEILREVTAGEVTAIFRGERPPEGLDPALGVRSLSFRLADGVERQFTPKGTLHFSDWRFDLFSPDGQRVLLPQDHYGPYHVVPVSDLAAYLTGTPPEHEVGQLQPAGRGAWVHTDGRWESDGAVVYSAGLETMGTFRFEIP